jgi:hypothetical protein
MSCTLRCESSDDFTISAIISIFSYISLTFCCNALSPLSFLTGDIFSSLILSWTTFFGRSISLDGFGMVLTPVVITFFGAGSTATVFFGGDGPF